MRILMRPCYDVGLKNHIFEPQDSRANHWQYPLYKLRSVAQDRGIEIDTWDMYPLSEADLILVQDLPADKAEIINAKKQAPHTPFILLLYESPLSRTHFYNPQNHNLFDAVITFNHNLCDENKYFHYQLPIGIPKSLPCFVSFDERKDLVMINTNKYAGLLAQRNLGWTGLPVIGAHFGGWKISWLELLRQQKSDLCKRRRKIARLAENRFPHLLNIYGKGWQGESISWLHKIIPPRPFNNAFGRTSLSKLETLSKYRFCLAFENIFGNYGYISEKIFDCFYAGVVPIYLGDNNISKYIPQEAFVDARQFATDLELLKYIRDCPKSVWQKMYDSGQNYLQSEAIEIFQSDRFVSLMLEIINKLSRNKLT
ncbi:MAG: glycosyltransferase family 10 [Xenococcaceae cyanobacterium MO_188.B32]|nr:glycosyltransferase family 10 [Xenococcaceae cyanobacterium MO_188.B32]